MIKLLIGHGQAGLDVRRARQRTSLEQGASDSGGDGGFEATMFGTRDDPAFFEGYIRLTDGSFG